MISPKNKALLELCLEKRMGKPRAVFRIPGASFDPFGHLTEDDRLMHNLMENMGTAPVWNYRHSCNEITFTGEKKKKLSSLAKVLIAVGLGIGLGLLARLLPGAMATFTLLTTQLGIPSAAMAFIIALDPITDRINTGTFITGLQMSLTDISESLGLPDNEKLKAK